MTKILCKLCYKYIAKIMPPSNSKVSFGSKRIRAFLTKKIVSHAGTNINVEKGAEFSDLIQIGDNSGIGLNCKLSGKVIIGNNVMKGPEVYIYTKNHSYERLDIPMCEQGHGEEKPVYIGNDVWIGSRVTMLPGVKIGDGSILGASAVVTKNVEQFSIVGGNPAKVIGSRLEVNKIGS